MKEIKEQAKLIRELRKKRNKYRDIKFSSLHYRYLKRFFYRYKLYIVRLIILIFLLGFIEAILVIFAKNQVFKGYSFLGTFFWYFFAICLAIFIFSSFFIIKQQKTIEVLFANHIRRRILKFFIEKPMNKMNYAKQADLIAKISYQLPLVSMGVSNVFFATIEWFVCFAIIIFISFVININLLIIIITFIVLSCVIGVSAYYISRKYISQEVTFFTKIMRGININASEKYFNKTFRQESNFLKETDHLVNIDSFFRIRRNLWMNMGFQIVFVIFLFIMVFSNFFSQNFLSLNNLILTEDKFLFLFLIYYFPRAFNRVLTIGLYLFPAKLGLFLTINKRGTVLTKKNVFKINNEISFSSKKAKIFKEGKYFRRLKFIFRKGERVLFYGKGFSGKTSLAKVFAGINVYNSRAFNVKIDNNRYDYSIWQRFFSDLYFFDPNFRSEKSLIEFILGKNKEEIKTEDIERVVELISENNFIASKILSLNNFNSSCIKSMENITQAFCLHTLHCILNKPSLIIIDNLWLDTNYNDIIEILNILNKKLSESIIIIFSRENNNYLDYQQKYELDNEITQVSE